MSEIFTATSSVQFCLHSCYYRDFFLLRTPITINGRPAVIKEGEGEQPTFLYDDETGVKLKLSEFSSLAARKLLQYGVYHVDTFYYDRVPLLSVVFQSKAKLKLFLENVEIVQTELGKILSQALAKSIITVPCEEISTAVEVDMKGALFLVSPTASTESNQVKTEEVTLANYSHQADTWQKSKVFDFKHSMFEGEPSEKLQAIEGDCEAKLVDLQNELKPVVEWFSLGVQLEIPDTDLLTIEEDYRKIERCRIQMLIRWGELEKPTWSKLVRALVDIDRKVLASKLAVKYAVPVLVRTDAEYNELVATCANDQVHEAVQNFEEKISDLEGEVEKSTQSRDAVSKALEMDIESSVPELQMKIDSLNDDIQMLKLKLYNKKNENQMLQEAKCKLNKRWSDVIEQTRTQNNERIKSLTEELKKKEDELSQVKTGLANKEKELSERVEELEKKSALVFQLQTQLQEMRESFSTEREEMDRKLIESKVHGHSREKDLNSQRDFAIKQVIEKSEEIKSRTKELSLKEEQIKELSEKIAEQEGEMAKLRTREELQLFDGQIKDTKQIQQQLTSLLVSTIQLKMEMTKVEEQQNQEKVNLQRAGKLLKKYEIDPTAVKLQWRFATSAPFEMTRDVDAAVDGDTVYIREGFTQNVFSYNSTHDSWSQLPDCPTENCAIAVVNNMLTTIGGFVNTMATNRLFSLVGEGGSKRWEERFPPMPTKRSRYTRAVCSETHLIVGAEHSVVIEVMNTSLQWSRVADLPPWSSLYSLVVCGEYLYSVHNTGDICKCSISNLIQSVKGTDIWSEAECRVIQWYSAYVSILGQLVSVGGCYRYIDGEPTTAVRMYSPTTKEWEVIGCMETPRWKCIAAVLPNNSLVVVGGKTSMWHTSTNRLEIATIV